jgi:hypothetical protein
MDYGSFYPQQQQQQQQQAYPNLTAANLQNLQTNTNNSFQLNPSPPTLTQPNSTDQCPNHQNSISPLQQNNIAPLQANMFYLDPFDTKVDTSQAANDLDHASYSSIPLHPPRPVL